MEKSSPEPHPDSAEFVALLTEHQNALRLYVSSLMPGQSQAADVAQQANATIWKRQGDFASGTNFKAWAFAIARYEVLNFRKKQARDSRLVFSEELEEVFAEEIAEKNDDLQERQLALQDCLRRLKSTERELITSRYYEQGTLAEYAARIGRSVGGLKVSLHRVRSKLQLCIEKKLTQPPTQS
ncbi:sigma-70 family RNA polymerase sigma factor [Roseibacillus ishigakijimensis]|uniref:Sigma-70 family RNA polymerase sigma factor n=1 Tax=Roseibacillus ishigakijimensis TaxID=454146 RepID=A0A934VM07_9BACT|nr:sigma-70 family RNA polymerase sigma factor [Roseibacillus ishigakijimensis]MBK1833626.1 sigma-70 family RNA polymerase sigma factor [Roseibacillus ishigakijimensis]